jgi:endonuclease/exonuclease/phosphatase family metal-dependent hydrolase
VLDHVFAKGFSPAATGVVNGLDVSDHAPIWADVDMLK